MFHSSCTLPVIVHIIPQTFFARASRFLCRGQHWSLGFGKYGSCFRTWGKHSWAWSCRGTVPDFQSGGQCFDESVDGKVFFREKPQSFQVTDYVSIFQAVSYAMDSLSAHRSFFAVWSIYDIAGLPPLLIWLAIPDLCSCTRCKLE